MIWWRNWPASCFIFRHGGVISCMHARDLKYKHWREITQILQIMYLAYVPRMGDYPPFSRDVPTNPETRAIYPMCWHCHSWAPPDGGAVSLVGEVCRRLRLPTHRVGSNMVLLQLPPANRISWNHFGSFHRIILMHTRYCRSTMG